MAGATAYATYTDVAVYLKAASLAGNQPMFTTFCLNASRGIDRYCERYFDARGAATRYFDGNGSPELTIAEHDFYSLTVLKIALNENNDFTDPAQAYTISGDGKTPPSNYYLGPSNPVEIGSVGDQTAVRPYYRITLPSNPKSGSTTDYLSTFTQGKRTVAITASWGWPQIPDEIKNLTVKVAIRMWKARDAGYDGSQGSPDIGIVDVSRMLDKGDLDVLRDYRRSQVF